MEKRLIRLEENCYFLEEKLRALDLQLASQQETLANLEKDFFRMKEILTEIRRMLADASQPNLADPRPPHYGPETW